MSVDQVLPFVSEELLWLLFGLLGISWAINTIMLTRLAAKYNRHFFVTDVFGLWRSGGRIERTAAVTAAILIVTGTLVVVLVFFITYIRR